MFLRRAVGIGEEHARPGLAMARLPRKWPDSGQHRRNPLLELPPWRSAIPWRSEPDSGACPPEWLAMSFVGKARVDQFVRKRPCHVHLGFVVISLGREYLRVDDDPYGAVLGLWGVTDA